SPCWSPDGKKIAYDSVIDGVADICVMNADGSDVVNLTQDNFKDFEPVWSPDGKEIAFATLRDGNREIYVMNSDGTNLRSVSNHTMLDDYPAWSPEIGKSVKE
ncbi:TolB family protein, partial [Candidatus Latescibacterota bacterium]